MYRLPGRIISQGDFTYKFEAWLSLAAEPKYLVSLQAQKRPRYSLELINAFTSARSARQHKAWGAASAASKPWEHDTK